MERRTNLRIDSELPVSVEAEGQAWRGTVINYSPEGALLRLEGLWTGAKDLTLHLDPEHHWDGFATEARMVRAASPDGKGTFLAVRF